MSNFAHLRRLDPRCGYKPLDFGNGALAGSIAPDGRLLMLSTYHPRHGYVTLSSIPPFSDEQRHDQAAVRAYRAALAAPDAPTFGIRVDAATSEHEAYLLADTVPHCRFRMGSLNADVTTWAPEPDGAKLPVAVQTWSLHNPTDQPVTVGYAWDGAISLSRASYTQLTESGALPPLSTALQLIFDGRLLQVSAPDAEIAAVVAGLPLGEGWRRDGQAPLAAEIKGQLQVPPQQTARFQLCYAMGMSLPEAEERVARLVHVDLEGELQARLVRYDERWGVLDATLPESVGPLAHRAQAYILDCCTLPAGEGICLLTDHQILPLSWTRDAYFELQALCLRHDEHTLDLMRRHLLWLFETAQRPLGYWGRAYLANGQSKDSIFQLDQQCYPLLELAEYARLGGDEATVTHLIQHVPAVLQTVLDRQAAGVALFATEETPADDPLPLPYHFSSHVLLWYTLRHLDELNRRYQFSDVDLRALAEAVQAAIWQYFVVAEQAGTLFAYAVDLDGNYHLYHDANDFPTVLAPLWGFCIASDPRWRATMEFALSSRNAEGYFPGPLGGLGSIHTPGAWPLGDVQEIVYGRLTGDEQRVIAALDRLVATACWDGGLPEARDPERGAVRSRHWFAWPSAALLAALLHPDWQAPHYQ